MQKLVRLLLLSLNCVLIACAQQPTTSYTPGLGEIMAQTANRHSKLWFAAKADNWELAAYELDELQEGFADAAHFHPSHKTVTDLPKLLNSTLQAPLAALEQAIKQQNQQSFIQSYNRLTEGCNNCHVASGFAFNIVKQPTSNPFSNQEFVMPRGK